MFNLVIGILTSPIFFIPVILIIMIGFIVRARKRRRERKKRLQQLRQRREAEESRKINKTDRIVRNTEHHRASAKGANSRYSDERLKNRR